MGDNQFPARLCTPKKRRSSGTLSSLMLNQSPNDLPSVGRASAILISSPSRVFEVIRRFDHRKKDLVKEIGFSGLLNLPRFGPLDLNFTLWIMQRVRWNTGALVVGDNINFVIREEHIGKILGIPYSGLDVRDKCFDTDDDQSTFIETSLSFLNHGKGILESAEQYLSRDLDFRCTKEICQRFKVAFVIFVMGTFLAPSIDKDKQKLDYWGALRNADAIHSFNWSAFVLSSLLEASRLVLFDVVEQKDVSVILGCPLIIQILYLDLIEIGHLKLQHNVIPRAKHFNSFILSKMIEADYLKQDTTTLLPVYGRAGTLRNDNTCYNLRNSIKRSKVFSTETTSNKSLPVQGALYQKSPANQKEPSCSTPITPKASSSIEKGNLINLDGNATDEIKELDQLTSITAHDYSSIMKDYFNGQVDNALLGYFKFHQAMCLAHITKFSKSMKDAISAENIALVSKVVNYQRRPKGLPDITIDKSSSSAVRRTYDDMLSGAESGNEGEYITPASNSLHTSSRFSGPPSLPRGSILLDDFDKAQVTNVPPNSSRPVKKFATYPLQQTNKGITTGSEFNDNIFFDDYHNSALPKTIVEPGKLSISHWEMNIDHPVRDPAVTHSFYDWLSTTFSPELNRPWIMHDLPRCITLTGQNLKDHFTDIIPFSYDTFDICIRRIKQLDKAICPRGVFLRWRHLFESDFAMHVLRGDKPARHSAVRNQVVSTFLDYELARCRMFFVPVLVDGLWWCYAWDMKCRTLTINDPSIGQETDDIVIKKHAGTIGLISKYLTSTMSEFYIDWTPCFEQFNYVVHRTQDMPIDRSQSAIFTLFFIKNFNGKNLTTYTSPIALQNLKEYMVYEILEMKDNCVKPPNAYIQSIDD